MIGLLIYIGRDGERNMVRTVDFTYEPGNMARPGDIHSYHKLIRPNIHYPSSEKRDHDRNAFIQAATLLYLLWILKVTKQLYHQWEDKQLVKLYVPLKEIKA